MALPVARALMDPGEEEFGSLSGGHCAASWPATRCRDRWTEGRGGQARLAIKFSLSPAGRVQQAPRGQPPPFNRLLLGAGHCRAPC